MPGFSGTGRGKGVDAESAAPDSRRRPSRSPSDQAGNHGVEGLTPIRQGAGSTAAGDGMMPTDSNEGVAENDINICPLGSLEPVGSDQGSISELLLPQLGSCGRRSRRESQTAGRKIISEVHSPPRFNKELRKMGHKHPAPGFALDLTVLGPDDGKPWAVLSESRTRR